MSLWWRLIGFGFRLLYNELAFTYDLVSYVVSLGAWRCWQKAALKHLDITQGARVLELAHGTGNLQVDLNAAGYKVVGYDLSPYMGRIAERKIRRQNYPVRLARGRAQQLPFPAGSFDFPHSLYRCTGNARGDWTGPARPWTIGGRP
jgi:ubiquinone/menaquinone biosynthesis C-methylase UbiE